MLRKCITRFAGGTTKQSKFALHRPSVESKSILAPDTHSSSFEAISDAFSCAKYRNQKANPQRFVRNWRGHDDSFTAELCREGETNGNTCIQSTRGWDKKQVLKFQGPGNFLSERDSCSWKDARSQNGAWMSTSASARSMHTEVQDGKNTTRSSINKGEITRFEKVAKTWWDVSGPYAGLHAMNPVRIGFIRAALCHHFGKDSSIAKPLTGLRILDVGCGGGLLCEPLARLGAEVTGVDATEENIRVAALHAIRDKATASIEYISGTAEQLVEEGRTFDAVMALEIIEHVDGPEDFVHSLGALCAPGGAVAISTLNRTLRSYAAAIVAAEYVAGMVPVGTHSWDKFVTPEEMALLLRRAGLRLEQVAGMVPNLLTMKWSLDVDTGVNYIVFATKEEVVE